MVIVFPTTTLLVIVHQPGLVSDVSLQFLFFQNGHQLLTASNEKLMRIFDLQNENAGKIAGKNCLTAVDLFLLLGVFERTLVKIKSK